MDTTDFNHENSNEIPNAWLHQCTALLILHEPLRLPVLLYVCRAEGVHVGLKLVHGTAKRQSHHHGTCWFSDFRLRTLEIGASTVMEGPPGFCLLSNHDELAA